MFVVLNWYLLGVEMNLGHAHKTRFWYLSGVLSKISDEHLRHFYRGLPPAPPAGASVTTMNSPSSPVARDYFLRVGEKPWERGWFELIIAID